MSTDPAHDPFAFVRDEAPRLMPRRGARRTSAFRRFWIAFAFISFDLGILACVLHLLQVVAIPGLPPMNEVKPPAATTNRAGERNSPGAAAGAMTLAKGGRPTGSTERNTTKPRGPTADDSAYAPLDKELSPEEVLQSAGLTKSGSRYVIRDESDLQKSLQETRPLLAQLKAGYKQLGNVLYQFNQLDRTVNELDSQRINLDSAVARQQEFVNRLPRVNNSLEQAAHEEANAVLVTLKGQLAETIRQLELGKRQVPVAREQKDEALRVFRSKRSTYLREGARLQRAFESLIEEYESLANDGKLKKSLDAIGRASGASFKVSPSQELLQGRDELKKALKSVESVDVPDAR
jgi:hypothetical protein